MTFDCWTYQLLTEMISRRCSSVVMFEQRVEDAEGRWLLLRFLLLRLLLLLLLWIPKRMKMLFCNMPKFLLGFSLTIRFLLNLVKPGPKLSIAWLIAAKRSLLLLNQMYRCASLRDLIMKVTIQWWRGRKEWCKKKLSTGRDSNPWPFKMASWHSKG